MAWKDRLDSYQESTAVAHEIEGMGELRFYPNRIAQLQQLRQLSGQVAEAVASLVADQRNDADAVTKTTNDGDFSQQETTISAVSTDVLIFRAEQQKEAIKQLLDLADQRSQMLLGEMFMDSLHLNAAGNRVMAEIVATEITRRDLLARGAE